jgi:hypothetical protein
MDRNNKKWHHKKLGFSIKFNSKKSNKFEGINSYHKRFNLGAFGDSYINRQLKAVI